MPEKKVPEEQLKFLRDKLAGSEAFVRLRGLFPQKLGILGQVLQEAKSPTDFCRRWDRFSSDARVIGNLLACCQRDGMNEAVEELSKALRDKAYRLQGETVSIHDTEPFTVVVFDFPRTLTMIRWIRCAHWSSLDSYLAEVHENWQSSDARDKWRNGHDRKFTIELFSLFPNLLENTRERFRCGDYEGWDLLKSYDEHVLDEFDHHQLNEVGHPLHLAHNTYNDHLEIHHGIFGYLAREDQGEVLSRFSREQQKRIATWTIRLPKIFADPDEAVRLFVGFHSERGHEKWKNVSNAYASSGCSHGYGAVAMAWQYFNPLRDHTCHYHWNVSISHVGLKEGEELAFELSRF